MALFLAAAFLAGGFYEPTYSLLAAAVWLGLAVAAALGSPRRPSPAFWTLAALGGWTAVRGGEGEVVLVALYAGALLAAEWADRAALRHALRLAIVVVCAAALVAYRGGRADWPVSYENGLGLVAAFGVLLSLERGRRLALPLCAAALVLTASRGALLALALGLVVHFRPPLRVVAPAAAAAAGLAVALAQPFASPAPDEEDPRRLLDVSGHGRADLWRDAWQQGVDAPVLGGGAGAYDGTAHSLPLQTFAELGLVGVVLVVAAVALLVPRAPPLAAAWALAAAVDWTWLLPAATLPLVLAAGGSERPRTGGLLLALAALAIGVAAGANSLVRGM